MSTQMEWARRGDVTPAMREAAQAEGVAPERVRDEIAAGRAVLPANPAHPVLRRSVVGRAFRTKVNANLGRSSVRSSLEEELLKLRVAVDAGADVVMDLSVGEHLGEVRRAMLADSPVPLGTVPVYEALARAGGCVQGLTPEGLLDVIRSQAEEGVDFMTLHAGVLRRHLPLVARRRLGIVSRGGAILAEWMLRHRKENPLYAQWDEVMEICARHDVTISLGDGLRPGCLADASDGAQWAELETLAELVRRGRQRGLQVMVEGPGHVPLHEIAMNMERQQALCDGAPFYVLGPLVTDVACGYDHIAAAIGAALAAYHGAALICYVTPAEHVALPEADDVRAGVIAGRIAAHAADTARGLRAARERDDRMADARSRFDWEEQFRLALDPTAARTRFERARISSEATDFCSMCGREFCALRATRRIRDEIASLSLP